MAPTWEPVRLYFPSTTYLQGMARLVSNCARPTRAFSGRALREQRRLTGHPSLPTPGGVSGGRAGRRQDPRSLLLSNSAFVSFTPSRDGAGLPSTARVQRSPSEGARCASKEGTQPHPNRFFSNSFTFPGFALPPLAFITCPTRNPSTCCLPSLNCATCVGFFASTSPMILSSAPSSDT